MIQSASRVLMHKRDVPCSGYHLVELVGPLATTAIQTVQPLNTTPASSADALRPPQIDICHALAATGEVVAKYWPRFHAKAPPVPGPFKCAFLSLVAQANSRTESWRTPSLDHSNR